MWLCTEMSLLQVIPYSTVYVKTTMAGEYTTGSSGSEKTRFLQKPSKVWGCFVLLRNIHCNVLLTLFRHTEAVLERATVCAVFDTKHMRLNSMTNIPKSFVCRSVNFAVFNQMYSVSKVLGLQVWLGEIAVVTFINKWKGGIFWHCATVLNCCQITGKNIWKGPKTCYGNLNGELCLFRQHSEILAHISSFNHRLIHHHSSVTASIQ